MKKVTFILILMAILLISCNKPDRKQDILAEVNGETLSLSAFTATFAEGEWESMNAAQKRRFVEDWVNLTLLAQEADATHLSDDPALKERIDFASKKVKANALIADRLSKIRISEDQLFSYFRVHQAEFQKPSLMYNIQRINLPDKMTAEKVLQQINQGMDFMQALRSYSVESTEENAGMMGFVEFSSPDSLFWLAARDLLPEKAGIVTKDEKWYVIRYTDTKESDKEASFEEHRAEIRRKILLEKQDEVYQSLLREIKAQNKEIYYY